MVLVHVSAVIDAHDAADAFDPGTVAWTGGSSPDLVCTEVASERIAGSMPTGHQRIAVVPPAMNNMRRIH